MLRERNAVFISHYVKRKTIKDDYWYSYLKEGNKKILRIYKQEELIHEQEANVADAFEVIFKGDKSGSVFITAMTPPRKDWEAVAWLLGYSKYDRTSVYDEYLNIRDKRREAYEKPGYVESSLAGPNFEFTQYSLVDDKEHEYRNLACWVDEAISKDEILHLVPEFMYPELYVRKVLKERFGISDEEFDKALHVFD